MSGIGLARLVASGLGTGYAPIAPGTVGSFFALLAGLGLMALHPVLLPLGIVLATIGGFWAIRRAGATDDPGWVVIDEVAGQWIVLLALSRPSIAGALTAFLLFRIFDIFKPGPIGWADRQPGPRGVMLDDLLAGILAAAILLAVRYAWPGIV